MNEFQFLPLATGYQIDERLRRRNTDLSPARRASGLDGDTYLEGTSDQYTGVILSCACVIGTLTFLASPTV